MDHRDKTNALMVGGSLMGGMQLAANNKLSKSVDNLGSMMKGLDGKLNQLNAQQGRMADAMERMAAEQRKANIRAEIKDKREMIERAVKETVFQLQQHIKLIETFSSPLDRFFLYRATSTNLNNPHLKTENIDSIDDKTYLVDTMELLVQKVKESTGEIPEEEFDDLAEFRSISKKKKEIASTLVSHDQTKEMLREKHEKKTKELREQHENNIKEKKKLLRTNYGDRAVSWWRLLNSEFRIEHNDKIKGLHMFPLALGSLVLALAFAGNGVTLLSQIFFIIFLIALILAGYTCIRFIKRKSTTFLNKDFRKEVVGREEEKKQEIMEQKEALRKERLETLEVEIDSGAKQIKELDDSRAEQIKKLKDVQENEIKEILDPAKSLNELDALGNQFLEKHSAVNDYIDLRAALKE